MIANLENFFEKYEKDSANDNELFLSNLLLLNPSTCVGELLKNIPRRITILKLTNDANGSILHSAEDKLNAWLNIPEHVTKVTLEAIGLYNLGIVRLKKLMKKFSRHVTYLHIQDDYLSFYYPPHELASAISNLKGTLIHLNLSENNLGFFNIQNAEGIAPILKAIPKNVNSLDLSNNNLAVTAEAAELVIANFKTIPSHVESLKISNNFFESWGANFLSRLLHSIPKTVTQLDFSDQQNLSDLLLESIPLHVTKLKLFNTPLQTLATPLPAHINTVYLKEADIKAITPEQRYVLRSVLININEIILVDDKGENLATDLLLHQANLYSQIGVKIIPSLVNQVSFFLARHLDQKSINELEIPGELNTLINTLQQGLQPK